MHDSIKVYSAMRLTIYLENSSFQLHKASSQLCSSNSNNKICVCKLLILLYSRMSFSWVCADLGLGCLMRSRQCKMRMTMTPMRITQTTSPTIIRISCQSTVINAKRHAQFNIVFNSRTKCVLLSTVDIFFISLNKSIVRFKIVF